MTKLFSKLKNYLVIALSFAALLASIGPATYAPIDADNLKLNFAVIADTHIATLPEEARGIRLALGLKDVAKAQVRSDAFVICGDLTERGTAYEYKKLGAVLNTFCRTDNLLPGMGNHDIRGIKISPEFGPSYEKSAAKYRAFLADTTDIAEDTIYFHKVIKDCYFIVLNTEEVEELETSLSADQLSWLDGLLAQAAASGNPVFVFNHQPMRRVGKDAAALMAVLQKYNGLADVFFIAGHMHDGFSPNTIKRNGSLYFVDLPAYGKKSDGEYPTPGSGFLVELYEGEIVFRARNFIQGEWKSECDWTIALAGR
ncbi:MAG TPA: metallophosphoesterase [Clostridia bacterium]|nr:metallophosphoesterase [Clostridia bacterium]